MTIADLLTGSPSLITQVGVLAVRCLLLGGVAAVGLAVFRVKSASARLFTWTVVLYGTLAMPLLGWMLPSVSVPSSRLWEVRPQSTEPGRSSSMRPVGVSMVQAHDTTRANHTAKTALQYDPLVLSAPSNGSLPSDTRERTLLWLTGSWIKLATSSYLAVFLALLGQVGIGLVWTRRLVRIAERVDDRLVDSLVASHMEDRRSTNVPKLAESEAVSVPVTLGVLWPVIVLPAEWRGWERKKLNAVIAHEISHVARRDAFTQLIALLHRAVFWFSPFAWWLQRHLAELAEEASDEAVLSGGADRTHYAQTLLGFIEGLQSSPVRVRWQGVAMAKPRQAERRVERILAWRGTFDMRLKKSMAVLIFALLLPVVYLTAALKAQQVASQPPSATGPQTAPVPAAAPNSQISPAPAPGGEPNPALAPTPGSEPNPAGAPTVAPVAPDAPVAAVAPITSWSDQVRSSDSASYAYGYDDDQRFVIVRGNSDSVTMSGSSQDAHHAERLRQRISGDFIWFQRDEKSYVIRDRTTVDRALKLWAPQQELGKRQEALGKQQEELGRQQEAIGKKMEEVRVTVPDMTAELDKLKAELKELSGGATQQQIGDLQSHIGELQSRIGELQSHAGEQQSKLGEEMGALGAKQGELGRQQGELGRQQGELAQRAAKQMKELLDEALKSGKAQPEPQADDAGSI
jgi:beta-lactamase regulating signal transducer with metallopeptidase domain